MGWANCGTDSKGRPIGYAHGAVCDHPGCTARIDRGLSYACGGMHGANILGGNDLFDGADIACEGYFCGKHLRGPNLEHEDGKDVAAPQLCFACADALEKAWRDDPEWREHWPTTAPPLNCAPEGAA